MKTKNSIGRLTACYQLKTQNW